MAENKLAKLYASLKVGDYVWVISLFAKQRYLYKNENLPVLVKTKIQNKSARDKFSFSLKLDKIYYGGDYYNLDNCFTDEKLARKKYLKIIEDHKDLALRTLDEIDNVINMQINKLNKIENA